MGTSTEQLMCVQPEQLMCVQLMESPVQNIILFLNNYMTNNAHTFHSNVSMAGDVGWDVGCSSAVLLVPLVADHYYSKQQHRVYHKPLD
jgi:hypothetical protein